MAELSAPMREFLDGVHFAVAATIASDGMPHQTVIWYALDADELVFNIPKGSLKHKHLQRDPQSRAVITCGWARAIRAHLQRAQARRPAAGMRNCSRGSASRCV
jgi:hypothetical protein